MKNEVRRHRFIPRKVLALFLTILMLLSITPVLTVGDTNPYQSLVDPPTGSAPATSVVDRTKAGNEFTVTIIGDASGPTDIFVASSRPSVDTFFYKKGSADWAPLTVSTGGGDGLSSTDIYVTVFIGANTNTISGNTEELALKVVSSSPGTSQIVFGIDAKDTVDYARGRIMSNGHDNIIQQRRYPADFDSSGGGGGGEVPGPINPYLSTVVAPSSPVYAVIEADKDAAGAEFTLNLVGPEGILYMASSRPSDDSFYYLDGGNWHPIPVSGYGAIDPSFAEDISPVIKKLIVKVVSTSVGTSRIVFGIDAQDVEDYANGVSLLNGTTNIIEQRRYLAEFIPPPPAIVITLDATGGYVSPSTLVAGADGKLSSLPTPTRSNYSFSGWFTAAADGTQVTTSTVFTADATIYAQWRYSPPNTGSSGGGTGGGGGGGPATITGGDGSVALMYNLSGSVVNLFLLEDEVKKILDASRDNLVVFDLSRLANGTGVTMPKGSLQDITTDGLALQFKMPDGSIALDAKAAKSALTQANSDKVTLMLHNVEHAGLTAAQKAAVKPGDLVYSISLAAGVQAIRNFDGTVTVSLPYDGPVPVTVWYLDSAGNLEKMLYSYNATTKMLTFNTDHLSLFVVGLESDGATRIRLTIGALAYTVGGEAKTMDAAPEIVDDRTMVPLRFIAEALGASVGWDGDSQTATVGLGSLTLAVTIGEAAPGMDVPAMIINDRTMVPLRYISEALGCEVVWNPDTQTIDIAK